MNIYKIIAYVFIISLLGSRLVFAQSLFPLEIGNEWSIESYYWDYSSPGRLDTSLVKIETDTTLSNSKTYFRFNQYTFFSFRYMRADSNYIYIFDEEQNDEKAIIRFDMALNESLEFNSTMLSVVQLVEIDSQSVFGQPSINYTYRLDGLMLRHITLSNKFGPIRGYSPGEPPGTSISTNKTIGCKIANSTFGHIVSVEKEELLPTDFQLFQNYPNPFNPSTIIEYSLNKPVYAKLIIYNTLGEKIKTLVSEERATGHYTVEFNGSNLSSGVYFSQLEVNGYHKTKNGIA